MTTISIYISIKKNCCYGSVKAYIWVSRLEDFKWKNGKTGFKYVTHTIRTRLSYNLEFLIPSAEKEDCYKCLKLCKNGNGGQDTIDFKNGHDRVYVYFYGDKDPRPLLVCYGNEAFVPRDKGNYDTEWEKAKGIGNIKNCVCEGTCEGDDCDKLLQALVKVVGFLNEVDLSMHPTVTNGVCSGVAASEGSTCGTTVTNGKSCTYVVDKYGGRQVMVKVKCEEVKGTGEPRDGCNYKKLTHEPIGMCEDVSKTGEESGFRLGDVVYKNNGGVKKGSISYYANGGKNGGDNWYKPLLKVTAYFYDADKDYKDPLLVVLEFKNGDATSGTVCEYYKLTTSGPGSMKWEKETDTGVGDKVKNPTELVKHLDSIRYCVKKILKVEIACRNRGYPVVGRAASITSRAGNNGFTKLNGGGNQVKVAECETGECPQLNIAGFKCFQHKLTSLDAKYLHEIGGVAFTIPGQGESGRTSDNKPIEIKLFNSNTEGADNCKPGENGQSGRNGEPTDGEPIKLFYNKCMGDVYVFFYDGTNAGGVKPAQVDTVPLMLWYDKNYYIPCDRDKYFTRWDKVRELSGQTPPSDGDGGETLVPKLVNKLNEVNRELNRIDLDPGKAKLAKPGTDKSGYGLPDEGKGSSGSLSVDRLKFPTMRVSLKRQDGPKEPPNNHAYTRIVHRTVNGFQIGDIRYGQQNFATDGVIINGTTIQVKKTGGKSNGDHKKLVTDKGCNTVVAYYSKDDGGFLLPQLIVIFKTDGPIVGTGKVTGSSGTGYGYYILTNKNGRSGAGGSAASVEYEYVWRPVENGTAVKLDDATDFSLLNSAVILIEQKCKNGGTSYNESTIKDAIRSAGLKSPGHDRGTINRITGKTITVSDVTQSKGTCLEQYGYKLCSHDFSSLVEIGGSFAGKLGGVTLIAGLRFLIPCQNKSDRSYHQITLFEEQNNGKPTGLVIKYHKDKDNKIYFYFYDRDPRPLLLCYNNSAYASKSLSSYFYWWVKDKTISKCECKESSCDCKRTGDDCCKLLNSLVRVSNFLNRVDISIVPRGNCCFCYYQVHEFKGQNITIKVEKTPSSKTFCYNKYTHTHNGTGSDGKGFRLGTIDYNGTCIKLNDTNGCINSQLVNGEDSNKYTAASKVVVFYYQGDNKLERPLLVALCNNSSNQCTVYYELQKSSSSSKVKKYKKGSGPIDLNNTSSGGSLDSILGRILSDNSKHLQIIIDQRPTEMLYCIKSAVDNNRPPDVCKNDSKCYKAGEARNKLQCTTIDNLKVNCKNNPGCVLLSAGKSLCYQAQLYEPKGSQLSNGSTAPTSIQVTQVESWQLANHGYKCYEHNLLKVENVDQIGGLKFYLWDNTEGKGQGASNPSNGKELCLYGPGGVSAAGTQDSCPATVSPGSAVQSSCGSAPSNTDLVKINTTYTTCKGNVYVFFYGDDPRPLLLCYDNNAYGPKCLDDYESKWVCVASGCCVVKDGKCTGLATEQILKALYDASMFLNPVQLGRTKCAFKQEKPDKTFVNGEGQNGKNGNGNSANGTHTTQAPKDPYKYTVHQYKGTCYYVTVKATDLSCYRRYTHAPEKTGFRLGDVSYYTKKSSDTCLCYNTSKQLISVALHYYMYDCEHKYPLIIELGFKGEVSEYFRYDHTKNLKWVKMVETSNTQNGQANNCKNKAGQTCTPNGKTPTDKETCELDHDFARNASRIEKKMIDLNKASPEFPYEYMKLNSQLIALIERRAYQIRKKLGLKWQKDADHLIMKTDKNCHEESMLMYVLGGGAMGVAGGGGWKAMVFFLGLLVKL